MHWSSILLFLTWPALIVLSWFLVKLVIRKYSQVFEKIEE